MVAADNSDSGNRNDTHPSGLFTGLPWDCPDPRPSAEALELARLALEIMKQKALAPTSMVSSAQNGSLGGIWMYFWDGSSYADLEFHNDGRVTVCFNTQDACVDNYRTTDKWQARCGKRTVEGYAVEPTEAGLKRAVLAILKRVDRRKTIRPRPQKNH